MPAVVVDRLWKRMCWVAVVAALAYLPQLLQLTYYRDDWYYAYDALVGPKGVFAYMFAGDRPARGPFFALYQALFGIAPTAYHAAMLFWRMAGGAAVAWLFDLLWPRRAAAGMAAGMLFAAYPGFTWWVQAIEYQPMVASAALMVLSLALTLQARRVQQPAARAACVAAAIVTGWVYLSLVEYAAGIELLRLCLIFLVVGSPKLRTLRARIQSALRLYLPYLIIPAGFVLWRFVLFSSERKATDLGTQLSGLLADPLATGARWLISLLLSAVSVSLAPWVQPLLNGFFAVSLRAQLLGLALAIAAACLVWWLLGRTDEEPTRGKAAEAGSWQMQAVWLGLAGLFLGIAPVIAANRQVTLPSFSHYALPASLGLVLLVAGVVSLIHHRHLRIAAWSLLAAISTLTHQGLSASALGEERSIAAFWHQMAWRAATIAPDTTLLVRYADVDYGSDSDVVWGPANFIYYPQPQAQLPVRAQLSALTWDRQTLNAVLVGHGSREDTYRSHSMSVDYARVLIAVQSAPDACVRVLDPRWQMFSLNDDPALRSLASASRVEAIGSLGPRVLPPASIFGLEPEHRWCFYFQKAAAAAQQGDWSEVASLQDELGKQKLHPNDPIEWMPFLQAQAYLGDLQLVKEIASRLNSERLYRQQACQNLRAMPELGYPLPAAVQSEVDDLFCGGAQ